MLGIVGAHRVGKSTLGRALEGTGSFRFYPISIGDMQAAAGYDSSNQTYDINTRIEIQEYLLSALEKKLHTIEYMPRTQELRKYKPVVTDRTPIDLIGYMLVHVTDQLTPEQNDWLLDYIERCIIVTNKYYSELNLIQPGIQLIKDNNTSASAQAGFIEHLNAIYLAYMIDNRVQPHKHIMPRELVTMDGRVSWFNIGKFK